jgi:hypothetical protein
MARFVLHLTMPKKLPCALLILFLLAQNAAAQEREWSLDTNSKDAFLTLGVPNTDDVGASFWCNVGSGSISIFIPRVHTAMLENETRKVKLSAGDQSAVFDAAASRADDASLPSLEGRLESQNPVFQAMAVADYFVVEIDGETKSFPLFDADIADLLRICRKL